MSKFENGRVALQCVESSSPFGGFSSGGGSDGEPLVLMSEYFETLTVSQAAFLSCFLIEIFGLLRREISL